MKRQIGLAKFHSVLTIWPWASGSKLKRVWGDIKQKRSFLDTVSAEVLENELKEEFTCSRFLKCLQQRKRKDLKQKGKRQI